jgi:hypothetical protein
MIVVRDDKKKTAAWAVPQIFTKEDFDKIDTATIRPIQITGVEYIDETLKDKNDGQIKIHTINGKKPVKYSIDSGQNYLNDSIFNKLKPGKYFIQVEDGLGQIASWPDTISIIPGNSIVIGDDSDDGSIFKRPLKEVVESKLDSLFSDPDNKVLRDAVLTFFPNQTMLIDCELIGIPQGTSYQLFQFLQRRFEGLAGSKRIVVLDIGYDASNHVNKLKVKEIKAGK